MQPGIEHHLLERGVRIERNSKDVVTAAPVTMFNVYEPHFSFMLEGIAFDEQRFRMAQPTTERIEALTGNLVRDPLGCPFLRHVLDLTQKASVFWRS